MNNDSQRLTKAELRSAKPENVRRLAKFLRLRGVDEMSDKQVIRLILWLLKRCEKRERRFID